MITNMYMDDISVDNFRTSGIGDLLNKSQEFLNHPGCSFPLLRAWRIYPPSVVLQWGMAGIHLLIRQIMSACFQRTVGNLWIKNSILDEMRFGEIWSTSQPNRSKPSKTLRQIHSTSCVILVLDCFNLVTQSWFPSRLKKPWSTMIHHDQPMSGWMGCPFCAHPPIRIQGLVKSSPAVPLWPGFFFWKW